MGFLARFDELHDLAVKATGLDDFGDDDYIEPLKLILLEYDKHNLFTPLGEELVTAEITGSLCGRLNAFSGFKNLPQGEMDSIKKPLFVIGVARSGTTATLRLLTKDPDAQCLQLWLAASPQPRPPEASWASNPQFQATAAGIEQAYKLAPEFRHIHPMSAGEADEDRIVTEQTFWHCGMASMATAPDLSDWCYSTDASFAYRYHRRVLNLIGGADTRRWVLKCPIHIWGLDALLKVYPDANIIFTHREPITSISSTASMVYGLRTMRQHDITPQQIGREMLYNWGRALDKAELIRQQYPAAQFFDLHISEVKGDPMGSIERIYNYFDIPLPEENRATMARFASDDPSAGHGNHDYSPEDFGLSEKAVNDAIGSYWERNEKVKLTAAKRHNG